MGGTPTEENHTKKGRDSVTEGDLGERFTRGRLHGNQRNGPSLIQSSRDEFDTGRDRQIGNINTQIFETENDINDGLYTASPISEVTVENLPPLENDVEDQSWTSSYNDNHESAADALNKKNKMFSQQKIKEQKESKNAKEKAKKEQLQLQDQQKTAPEASSQKSDRTTFGPKAPKKPLNEPAYLNTQRRYPRPPVKPDQPKPVDLVSEEAKVENAQIVDTLINKSSEMDGLAPVIDRMIKDDPLVGEAVAKDLVHQLGQKDPEAARQLEENIVPIQQKHASAIQNAQENSQEKQIISNFQSGIGPKIQKAINDVIQIRADSEEDYQALPEEIKKSFEAYMMKYHGHAANFFGDTPKQTIYHNSIASSKNAREAGASLYSGDAMNEEFTKFLHDTQIAYSLLMPEYEKFDKEIKKLQEKIPKNYRKAATLQGNYELVGLAREFTPGVGSISSGAETAKKLAKAGFSLEAQRIGAGIAGLSQVFGGKLGKEALNVIIVKTFGKNLKKISSKELSKLSDTLFDKGISLSTEGIVNSITEQEKPNNDEQN